MKHFKTAAIIYKNKDGNLVERHGCRHYEIIRAIHNDGDIASFNKWHIEGFIYGEEWTAQFVDREEATKIAKEQGIKMR